MQQEERSPVAPPTPPTSSQSSSLLLFAIVLLVSSVGAFYFTETTLVSPLAPPLLLLIAGTLFVLKSYRRYRSPRIIIAKEASQQSTTEQQSSNAPVSTSPPSSPQVIREKKTSRTGDASTPRTSGSLPIDFNVRTTVEETILRFLPLAKEKGVELSCLFSADSPVPFYGDPGELRLILLNLIDYALSSISTGEVTIHGALVDQTSTHTTFRFSVSAMQKVPTVSSSSTLTFSLSDHNKSSPIASREVAGLALSKQLVQHWGGKFGFEKHSTLGVTVWFTLTLEQQSAPTRADLAPRTNLSGARMLVVSDTFPLSETDVRTWEMTSHRLSSFTPVYSTLTAAAQEGQPYDLLLLHCPSLDDSILALATRIRNTATLGALRLVLLTNWGRKGEARKVHDAGFDAYITNPASSTLLFECFTTLLGQPPLAPTFRLPLVTRYTLAEARMRGRNRILVVESNLSEQKHAVRLIEELGYRAVIATTAREAIESCTPLSYTAVLLPAQVPGIDGIAAAEQIRRCDRKERRHTPLVGIISSLSNHERQQCLAVGMDTVIERPVDMARLKDALQHCQRITTGQKEPQTVIQTAKATSQVNFHEALARIEGEKELFDDMAARFVAEYPQTLRKMRDAVAHHDAQVLAYNANILKGTLKNFSATQAMNTTLQLEEMGRRGDFSLASPTLTDLEKQLTHLQTQLMNFQNQATV